MKREFLVSKEKESCNDRTPDDDPEVVRQAYSRAGKDFVRWFYFERAGALLEGS